MRKLIVVFLVLIALVAMVTFLYLPAPSEEEINPDPLNNELYSELMRIGIRDAVVDITDERALIRYNLPEGMSREDTELSIMKAAATIAPDSDKIVIQTYENFKPVEEVTIGTSDVLDFMEKTITYEEFKNRIKCSVR